MKRKLFYILIITLWSAIQVHSQDFTIKSTDVTAYPVIRSRVHVPSNVKVQASDFKLIEDRKEVDFTLKPAIDSSAGVKQNKAIFVLIEASGFTYGKALENFKKAVNESLSSISPSDKINVGYFGKANNSGRTLNILSAEFTSDISSLKSEINSRVAASKDTTYVTDVYKAIYEALDFMVAKQDLPDHKRLIVLSAAINNSRSPIKAEDCIEKAQRLKIPIYTVTYKTGNRYAPDNFVRLSDRTNGETTLAKTLDEIKTATKDFISSAANKTTTSGDYILEFATADRKSGRMYQYEVRYKDQKLPATYTAPADEGGFLSNYGLYIFMIVALIGGGMAWFIYQAKQKKIAFESNKGTEQETLLRETERREQYAQPEIKPVQKSTPQPEIKKDLKRTIIAGGETSPVLMVTSGNFSHTFSLDRPQMSIGRATGNDIVIPEPTISGKHATIMNENGTFFLTDIGSTNGTFINNIRIQNKQIIKPGDNIRMGAAQIRLQV